MRARIDAPWRVTTAGFLSTALSSPGQTYVLALYTEPLMLTLSATRTDVSGWYSLATLVAAAGLTVSGRLADRHSPRRFMTLTLATVAAGVAVLATAVHAWQVVAAFILLRLAGQGAVGVGLLALVARHAPHAPGRRLGVANLGYGAGEILFPLCLIALIASVGWRASLWAVLALYVVAVPTVATLLRTSPPVDPDPSAPAAYAAAETRRLRLRQILGHRGFWPAQIGFTIAPVVTTALFFHQIAVFRSAGLDAGFVPLAFAGHAVSTALSSAVLSWWIDRLSFRLVLGGSLACMAGALLLLALPGAPWLLAIGYGLLLGLASAASGLAGALIWPRLFGLEAIGQIRGLSSGLRNAATAVGPVLLALGGASSLAGLAAPLLVIGAVGVWSAWTLPSGHVAGPNDVISERRSVAGATTAPGASEGR